MRQDHGVEKQTLKLIELIKKKKKVEEEKRKESRGLPIRGLRSGVSR